MKTRQDIIARIRACRKLADPKTNANEFERKAAERAANILIEKYKITAKELGEINSTSTTQLGLSPIAEVLRKNGVEIKRGWNLDPTKVSDSKKLMEGKDE